jgi:CheY-like chemotaxis protein
MMQVHAEQRDLRFVYDIDPNLPDVIRADEKRLQEVLINLLGNAIKFTEKGKVTFRVKRINELDEFNELKMLKVSKTQKLKNSKTQKLLFEIEDTGIGIAPDKLEEIFLPFQQIRRKSRPVEGTGLGLAISRRLITMMGDELRVKSAIGKGSFFWFELHLPEVSGVIPSITSSARKIVGYKDERRKVLIVDDIRENRNVLMNILAPLGFDIIEAENGQECIEKAHSVQPDVILLDLRMPVMDGFEAARQIRKLDTRSSKLDTGYSILDTGHQHPAPSIQHPASSIQHPVIIAISASVFEKARIRSLEAGCDDFLTKPFQLDDLLELFHTHLHLEWIYAEDVDEAMQNKPQSDIESVQAVLLPPKHVKNLIELAERGSPTKLFAELNNIEQQDVQYAPVIHKLRELTKRFQFEDILTFLKDDSSIN